MPVSRSLRLARILTAFSLLVPAAAAFAQDPGMDAAMQANQMAMQAAQQANQQAIQDMLTASQIAQQQSMMAMQTAQNWQDCCAFPAAAKPVFSRRTGAYKAAIDVRLIDTTPGAVVYYTTDGWMPTSASTPYTGPVRINSTTVLQAIAIAPHRPASPVATATYVFPSTPQARPVAVVLPVMPVGPRQLVLGLDTPIPLIVAAPVDSGTALMGDPMSFALAEDLEADGHVIAPKGAPAAGTILRVNRPGTGGMPGQILFRINALRVNGALIPLRGSETMAGKSGSRRAVAIAMIPFFGLSSLLVQGDEAHILPGAVVTATMAAGTILPASSNIVN